MNEREMIQALKKDVEIPEVVQTKANEAFAKIRADEAQTHFTPHRQRNLTGRRGIAAAMIAILAAASFTVGAAAHSVWSNAFLSELDISEEQKPSLEQNEMVDFIGQSVTDKGVTITAEQCAADDSFAYIVFKVEGYDLPNGKTPAFHGDDLDIAGSTDPNGMSYFYSDDNGHYVAEDGSLEYICTIDSRYLSDYFGPTIIGKRINIELRDLGTCISDPTDPTQSETIEVEGCWKFSWILQGTEDTCHYDLEASLGDSEITLVSADITSLSIKMAYRYPAGSYDPHGLPFVTIQMKDGTTFQPEGSGTGGRLFPTADIYATRTGLGRIIDPKEIEALLVTFPSSKDENGRFSSEPDTQCIIPINTDSDTQ